MSQGMDLPDIQVVVQWRASCNLMTLWQRLGRGARDRIYTAVAIFLVEKEYFDEEREKKFERQRIRTGKAKRNLNAPLQPITNKRIRTESSTSQRASIDDIQVESCSGSSDESEPEVGAPMDLVKEGDNFNNDEKISQLRHRYSTTVFVPRKKKSDPLEPAMEDLINAKFRKLECRKIPIQAYLEMNDVCKCSSLLSMINID